MIREAAIGDAARIAEIHVQGWQSGYATILPSEWLSSLSIEKRTEKWKTSLEKGEKALVAEKEGVMVGWVSFGPCRDEDRVGEGEVYAIYLQADFWGHGVGTLLMKEAERKLDGFSTISIWVLEKNQRARRFYEKLGYCEDGSRKELQIANIPLTEIRYTKSHKQAVSGIISFF